MRYALAALLAACFVAIPLIFAGQADKKEEKKEEKKDLTPKEQLAAIQKEHRDNEKTLEEKFQESTDPAEKKKLQVEFQKASPFAEKSLALAQADPKSDLAFDALLFALSVGPLNESRPKVLALMTEHHVDQERFARVVPTLARDEPAVATKTLEGILSRTKNKSVKGVTLLSLGNLTADAADAYFSVDQPKSDAMAAKALKYLQDVQKNYAEVSLSPRMPNMGEQAEGRVFELTKLRVGMTAPEVESETLAGKKAKLSDLRGKVVVLDIWATWCGPCRAMIPHSRKMVEKFKDKPFEMVSISADDDKADVESFVKKEEMPWTHWYAGPGAGVVKTWNVRAFPTVYVLDAKGVIRFKDLRDEDLEAAVEKLLAEAK